MTETARRLKAIQASIPNSAHGEGPVWDAKNGLVRWVDMPGGLVRNMPPDAAAADFVPGADRVADFVAIIRPRVAGGWILCTRDSILLTDARFDVERSLPVPMGEGERFNDGTCAPDGSFYCGTLALNGTGRLMRLHPDGNLETVLTGVTISNGISATPDGSQMVYVDTPLERVEVFDIGAAGLSNRRTLIDLSGVDGVPDGLAVDAEGGVWVAMWGGSCVRGYDARGRLTTIIEVPTLQPSACTFVGDALDVLAVTTSQEDLDVAAEPLAGALFVATPGVSGLVPLAFLG